MRHIIIHKKDRIPLITIKSLHQIKVVDYVAGPNGRQSADRNKETHN